MVHEDHRRAVRRLAEPGAEPAQALRAEPAARLPGPLGAYTSVETCAAAFLRAIERRSRRVFVPRSLTWVEALRPLVLGPLGDASVRALAAKAVPELEANFRRLGRSFGRHSVG